MAFSYCGNQQPEHSYISEQDMDTAIGKTSNLDTEGIEGSEESSHNKSSVALSLVEGVQEVVFGESYPGDIAADINAEKSAVIEEIESVIPTVNG